MTSVKRGVDQMVGRILRKLRKERGLTQAEVAEAIETNEKYISSIERGRSGAGRDILKRYCEFFGITQEQLLDMVEKQGGGAYPPLVKMAIEQLMNMSESEQAEILALIMRRKEGKAKE